MLAIQIDPIEYNPYYKKYIDLVDKVPLIEALSAGMPKTLSFFEDLPEQVLNYRYAEGKWTPKDILLHIIDTERVFSYRALYFSRDENANLAGFDENLFAKNANADSRNLDDLLNEYLAVRTASICLFKSFDDTNLMKSGIANNSKMSVRASGFVICGHELHHLNIIKERYLI